MASSTSDKSSCIFKRMPVKYTRGYIYEKYGILKFIFYYMNK